MPRRTASKPKALPTATACAAAAISAGYPGTNPRLHTTRRARHQAGGARRSSGHASGDPTGQTIATAPLPSAHVHYPVLNVSYVPTQGRAR
jgi:hypothetical protein